MAKYCKQCGTQLEEGARFCPECGTTIVTAAAPPPPIAEPVQAPPPPIAEPVQAPPPPPAPQPQVQPAPPPPQPQVQPAPPPPPQQDQFAPPPPPAPPQGGYAPAGQPGYPVQAAPKKKLPKALKVIIIIAAVIAALVIIGSAITGSNAKKEFFDIGPDQIPSVMYVLGEVRNISGISSSASGDVQTMVIAYKVSENQGDEMYTYSQALMNDFGFYNTNPFNFNGPSGSGFQFAKASVEEGFIIMLTIDYDETGYVLTVVRSEGTLTIYDNEPAQDVAPPAEDTSEGNLGDPGPAAGEVDLVVPMMLSGSIIDYEDGTAFDPSMQVISQNMDGSFTIRVSAADQQRLIETSMQETEDMIMSIYEEEMYAGIADIEWDNENFGLINFLVTEEFLSDDSLGLYSILMLGYMAPMVQVYMGYGLDSSTIITVTDVNSGIVYLEVKAPDGLMDIFG